MIKIILLPFFLLLIGAVSAQSTGTLGQYSPLLLALILIGIYLIVFGAFAPGHGSEIAGVLLFISGLIGLGFEVDSIAISLLIFGLFLMIAESSSPGFG